MKINDDVKEAEYVNDQTIGLKITLSKNGICKKKFQEEGKRNRDRRYGN